MRATTSIMISSHILLLSCAFCLLIIRVSSRCPIGQLQHGDKCCRPVMHCPSEHYVKTCNRDGSCDECLPCASGTQNAFNTSSFDIKKCYKNDCSTDTFPVSENECKCALHLGYRGNDNHFCQISNVNCLKGQELTNRDRCEDCENNHYKPWVGYGYCIKDIDCSKLGLPKIAGNLTTPSTCQGFDDKCSPKERRSPPLLPPTKPQTSPTVASSSTTATTRPPVPVTTTTTTTTARRRTMRMQSTKSKELKTAAPVSVPPSTEKPDCVAVTDLSKTSSRVGTDNALDLFKAQYIYITIICALIIIIIILLIYIGRIKYKTYKKEKQHNNNYQQIDTLRKVSPNDIQRPLPKKPSSSNLIDTYMEMGKSAGTLKRSVPYIISSPYDPSTLNRLIQQPGMEGPLLHPVYQQNTQAMMRLIHCSPPRQESNTSGEDEFDNLRLGSSSSMRDCSMSSETALKVPDTSDTYPNRFETASTTEATRVQPERAASVRSEPARVEPAGVEPARIEPLRGIFDQTYQDAISIHTTSDYSPPINYIPAAQVTRTGVVLPQFVHYTQPMNRTRNREYV